MKKLISALLACSLTAASITGCSGSGAASGNDSAKTTASAASGQTAAASPESEYLCSDKPVTFTFFNIFDGITFDPSWQVFEEAAKLTNVSLESSVSQSASDETTAYNLMLSSGKLADIISYASLSELEKLGRDGGLIPLNDLIDEHAPNLKKALDENDLFRKIATSTDGSIFVIPKLQNMDVAEADFIRTDWLEKLNLETPDTIDELYTVLKAFRENDPNGNGVKDEIPFFSRQGNKSFNDVLNLWDAHDSFYVRDGKVTFGPMEDEFKLAMTNAIQWYQDGIIDPEWFTRGPGGRDILLGGNLGGYCNDWVGSNYDYNPKLEKEIPGFRFECIAPVENQNGERILHTTRAGMPGWGISSQCKDPVAVIKYFDFWFSEAGDKLTNYGIDGVTYTEADGKVSYTDAITQTDKTVLQELRNYGVQYRIGMIQDYEYERAWITEEAAQATDMLVKGNYVHVPIPQLNGELGLKYDEATAAEYSKLMASINPFVMENIQKWVLGSQNFDTTYDKFIEDLKNKGIERAMEINQTAFELYNAS